MMDPVGTSVGRRRGWLATRRPDDALRPFTTAARARAAVEQLLAGGDVEQHQRTAARQERLDL